jgi:hypothetical protein
MRERNNSVLIIFFILFLLTSGKIDAKTCCTRRVTVDISGSAVEASLATAMWVNLFSSEGGSSLTGCPILIVGPGGCIDYQFKGVLLSGPVGGLDMKLIDCVHNTIVKEASITWPCISFPNPSLDIMMNFIAPFASCFQPLDKIIFDYERIPEHCEIEVGQEEVSPGQKIQVKLSDIIDSEGRKSREFNRIVVYASKGEVLEGTELDSDPRFKAFQVGDGSIVFSFKAPDTEDNPGNSDDTIFVYNSCDIRSESLSSMSGTELRDKIAEKKIKMVKADVEATLRAKCHSGDSSMSIDWEFTFKAICQYHDTIGDEETYNENYDVKSCSLSDVSGTIIDKTDGSKAEAHQGEIDDMHPPDSMWIEFDTKTGIAKAVNFPVLGFDLIFNNGAKMLQTFGQAVPGMCEVKTGDGMHELGGGGSFTLNSVTFSCEWSVRRHRR